MLKPWILHVVLAWQITPVNPEEQKTIVLQFNSRAECISIARQVDHQVKMARSVFYLKGIRCVACVDLVENKARCPVPAPAKKKG